MKWLSVIAVCLLQTLEASTIPKYQIQAIEGTTLTCSNGAVFDVLYDVALIFKRWEVNDFIQIIYTNKSSLLFPRHTIWQGRIISAPFFLLKKGTNEALPVITNLQEVPIYPSLNTFIVTSIDLDNRIITLSDSSEWQYSEVDQTPIRSWEVNDIIMLGISDIFPPSIYTSALLNTNRKSIIRTLQR